MSCSCPITVGDVPSLATTCGGLSYLTFVTIVESLILKQCDIVELCERPKHSYSLTESYDYVVIGAGTAGSVVAERLSEDNDTSVLVIEAGLNEPPMSQVPALSFNYIGTAIDWKYHTEKEDRACLSHQGICSVPRGKVLGGTSVINGMMYMRGSRKDYDDWEKLGNPGWSYKDVLPFFKKSEDNIDIREMDKGYHGVGGLWTIARFPYHPSLSDVILEAGKEIGYKVVDLNGKSHTGFAVAQASNRKGSRLSASRAFLRPARNRKNLKFSLNSTATRIIFDIKKAVPKAIAVEFVRNGIIQRVNVLREVIISGGAINSPHLLLHSGIGPKDELKKHGIPVVHHLPGVGQNLQNHVGYSIKFRTNQPHINDLNTNSLVNYLRYRTGPLSSTGLSQTTAFVNTKFANPDDDHPDLQIFFNGYSSGCAKNGHEVFLDYNRTIDIVPTLLHMQSKGYIRLRDENPLSKPLIYAKYFTNNKDMERLIDGIKIVLRLSKTKALQRYGLQLDSTVVKGCEHITFGSDAYWQCAIEHNTVSENHHAGSCKMGPSNDPLAVVDQQLKVKGVEGVRVADTSIMPKVISGNTATPAVMIGERAANFIKQSKFSQ